MFAELKTAEPLVVFVRVTVPAVQALPTLSVVEVKAALDACQISPVLASMLTANTAPAGIRRRREGVVDIPLPVVDVVPEGSTARAAPLKVVRKLSP
jgi:hypothetical protein